MVDPLTTGAPRAALLPILVHVPDRLLVDLAHLESELDPALAAAGNLASSAA